MSIAPGSLAITSDVRFVIMVSATALGVSEDDLVSHHRHRPLVDARHIAMRAARLGGHSTPVIGRAFGGRDHTTVLHACRRVEALPELERRARIIAEDIAHSPRSLF